MPKASFFTFLFFFAFSSVHADDFAANLLTLESGAKVIGYSSEYGGWDAASLVPSEARLREEGLTIADFVWCTADNAPFPHWVLIEFDEPKWVTTFVLNNALKEEDAYPGISARNVEIWVGNESIDELHLKTAFELERNKNGQSVQIEPTVVRWIKFNITSNWGHAVWTEMNAAAALDDGSRPADLAAELSANGKIDVYGIYFDFAKATLRAESRPTLEQILAFHKANPLTQLFIEGHTDSIGGDRHNLELSEQRAKAVVDELMRMGADATRFAAVGLGASQPVADNATDIGRAKNRRVTIKIQRDLK